MILFFVTYINPLLNNIKIRNIIKSFLKKIEKLNFNHHIKSIFMNLIIFNMIQFLYYTFEFLIYIIIQYLFRVFLVIFFKIIFLFTKFLNIFF